MALTHNPSVFAVRDLEEAKRIILTPQAEQSTEERWARETPYLTDLIAEHLNPSPGQVLIDYGCGVGRLSGALIERHACRVLGVDISPEMRALAARHLPSPFFAATSRSMLEGLCQSGFQADAAIVVWVLQHVGEPADDIGLLRRAIRPGGKLLVVNMRRRAVPTVEAPWVDDGRDVRTTLRLAFQEVATGDLDPEKVGAVTAEHSFWAVYS
jgi:cyclopropane fatty-acyl-phospholipid synthase-like methyltransferase